MTVAVHKSKRVWTEAELLAMPKDGCEREVVDGELIVSPAGLEHGLIVGRILGSLYAFTSASDIGEVFDGQTGCRMKNEDVFSPDVSFVTTARLNASRNKMKTFFQGGPDLVVEVLSPGDTVGVIEEKIAQYFENGTRLAWVVHPRTRSVQIYHGPVADKILSGDDSLDGEDVAPGFTLSLGRLFR